MISGILLFFSVILYLVSLIVGCMGIDKITNYVGGDAYNYIINGIYSTSFFVIASALAIIATMFLCTYLFKKKE